MCELYHVDFLLVERCDLPSDGGAFGREAGGEVGLGLLDDAAERLENVALRIDGGADARVDGDAVEVFEPGDAHALEVAVEGAREEAAGLIDGERRADVGARDRAECKGEI